MYAKPSEPGRDPAPIQWISQSREPVKPLDQGPSNVATALPPDACCQLLGSTPEVLAFQYRSGLQENEGTLWDVVNPTRKFATLSADTPAAWPSFQGVGSISQNPITHLNHHQQEFSAPEANTPSSIQPVTQEESIPHRDKRQKLAGLTFGGHQQSNFHTGDLSTSEPTEWFSTASNLGESFSHQAEAHLHPFEPSTEQTSYIALPQHPVYDSSHSAGLASYEPGNTFTSASTSNGPDPNYHPDSRSSHFDNSLLWPSNLDRVHEQQRLKELDEWLNGSDYLQTIVNPIEDHQEEQSPSIDGREEYNLHGSASISPLLLDHDILRDASKQIEVSHGVRSDFQPPTLKPTGIHTEARSSISEVSSEVSEPRRDIEHQHANKDSRARQASVDYENIQDEPEKNNLQTSRQNRMEDTVMPMKLLDSVLVMHSYPKHSMSGAFLARFTQKFEQEISYHFQNSRITKEIYQAHEMKDVSAVLSPVHKAPHNLVVRIIGTPVSDQNNHNTRTLTRMFGDLLQWLIFINTALLRISNQNELLEKEVQVHEELTDFLLRETFAPSRNSLPILGIIGRNLNQPKTFGIIQIPLVRYLTKKSSTTEIIELCITILQQYNREANNQLGRLLDEGPDLILNVKRIVYEATKVQMRVDRFEDSLTMPTDRIGSFRIPDLSLFPEALKPVQPSFTMPTQRKYEDLVIRALALDKDTPVHMQKTLMVGLPVELVAFLKKKAQAPITFIVKIIRKTGLRDHKKELSKKLTFLFSHLQICHRLVLDHLTSLKNQQVGIPTEDSFFQWISDTLIAPGNDHYPLFGVVKGFQSPKIFEASNFNEVQTYLIHYLSDLESPRMVIQVSLALIGYHYRNYFKSDQVYWTTMIFILRHSLHEFTYHLDPI
ncbi:hypothetical protein PGTUg99_037161 [Puccinia graminis f. sp. tritici]|uniref:Uncharacterized protein n=1 Tax=Puccinia graminis f. sp. tritici TaxID=56615 RepID=A0A5B0PSH3_PUCGR|nr:hypothetical protein PGTUg99_037161 [Puccinia graminis f. sp. tritici]